MVVSIPVNHPDAPPRNGMVRGYYESIEMIREIPLSGAEDPETNPVEWIMVTRSDPGGGIPRFMVERNVPSSIVQDAVKFLDWACPVTEIQDEVPASKDGLPATETAHEPEHRLSVAEVNGIGAGVGTSIADRPSNSTRRASHRAETEINQTSGGLLGQLRDTVDAYVPDYLNPLQRTVSSSSSSSSSSIESFASADEGLSTNDRSKTPEQGAIVITDDSPHGRKMKEIEDKKQQLKERLAQAQEKQKLDLANESDKTQKEMEKAAEKHSKERKRQEDKYQKEIRKLEERREKETQKLLARQKKDEENNKLLQAQRARDEFKQRADILEEENKLLKDQIGELQKENTALVARLGKTETGQDILRKVQEEDMVGRTRASSRASRSSGVSVSGRPKAGSDASSLSRVGTETLK
jgi:hypothetical protein